MEFRLPSWNSPSVSTSLWDRPSHGNSSPSAKVKQRTWCILSDLFSFSSSQVSSTLARIPLVWSLLYTCNVRTHKTQSNLFFFCALETMRLTMPQLSANHLGEPKVRWSSGLAQQEYFFTFTDLTLSVEKLTDRAKNSPLDNEGWKVFMAPPVAEFTNFSKDVSSLFEQSNNPVRQNTIFTFIVTMESGSDYLTALHTLHIDCNNFECNNITLRCNYRLTITHVEPKRNFCSAIKFSSTNP